MRLTREEITLITVLLVALLIGAIVQRYRQSHPSLQQPLRPTERPR